MTNKRAALYFGGATLLGAWLASAASLSLQPGAPQSAAPALAPASATEHLATDVQAQARRLRDRLAAAPVPQPVRNPFAFAAAPARRSAAPHPVATAGTPAPIAAPPEPVIDLVGIAEDRQPAGLVRSAMLVGSTDDVLVVKVGETVIGRYTVTAISTDSIELADAATGQVRRLSIR